VGGTAAQIFAETEVIGKFLCAVVVAFLLDNARGDDGLPRKGLSYELS